MLSIIIPAYNEEKRLPEALDRTLKYLKNRKIKNEIIIVADKSKDRTLDVVQEYTKKFKNVCCIYNPKKQGKGHAVRKGILASKGSLVLFIDADTSTPITELDKFLPKIKNYDIVIGSREHKDSDVRNKLISRVILGNLGNLLLRLFLIKTIRDTQCGFKLFNGNIARELFSLSRINGFGFDFEIIFLAQKKKYRIMECPVNWAYCDDTKVTWQSHFKTLSELFEIKMNQWSGKYKI
ncbi:MAG: glycosyltransferase family 2 protein [Candidatus Woesearchaeota archaeon]|jgi:dolichyl-phosphate beta-glucosyltransferase|nr:glycosyltransferase family 2 protein [Candidatus Woesearchaeota archaeon]